MLVLILFTIFRTVPGRKQIENFIYRPDPLAMDGLTNVSHRLGGFDRLGLVTYY